MFLKIGKAPKLVEIEIPKQAAPTQNNNTQQQITAKQDQQNPAQQQITTKQGQGGQAQAQTNTSQQSNAAQAKPTTGSQQATQTTPEATQLKQTMPVEQQMAKLVGQSVAIKVLQVTTAHTPTIANSTTLNQSVATNIANTANTTNNTTSQQLPSVGTQIATRVESFPSSTTGFQILRTVPATTPQTPSVSQQPVTGQQPAASQPANSQPIISNQTTNQQPVKPTIPTPAAIQTNANQTSLQAKFQTPLPLKSEVTLQVTPNNSAKVIDAKPPSPVAVSGPIKLMQPVALTNVAEISSNFTPKQYQQIITQTRIMPIETPPQAGTTLIAKTLGKPILIEQNTPTITNANIQTNIVNAGQSHQQTLQLDNGLKLIMKTPLPISEGTPMAIRFTADGVAEVLRVLPQAKTSSHVPIVSGNEGRPDGSANQQAAAKHHGAAQNSSNQAPLKPGSIHLGTITSQGDKGVHTLTFQDGRTFQVQAARTLPINAQVKISVTPEGNAQIVELTLPAGTTKTNTLTSLSLRWENMEKAISVLQRNNPELAQKLTDNIPKPSNFLPALMSFSEAIASNSLEKILNTETLNVLRALGIDFTSDMNGLNQLQQKNDSPDSWRSFLFPYIENEGEDPRQGSFFWRNQNEEGDSDNKHVRFVVNMAMSNIGSFQIDGLMHDKNLNIKLRLHEMTEPSFEAGLKLIYKATLDKLGLTGDITVESTDYFEADPLYEVLSQHEQINVTI